MYVCMSVCMYVCMYVRVYIHTHTHTHTSPHPSTDNLIFVQALAIKEEAGGDEAIAPVFSRNRGFRRRFKRYGTGLAELE